MNHSKGRNGLPVQLPALDSILGKLGALGGTFKAMEAMQQQLQSNPSLSPETLMRQTFGANGLASIVKEEESPFVEVSPGIFERVTVTGGYDAFNDLDVRITPEALQAPSQQKSGVKMANAALLGGAVVWGGRLLFTVVGAKAAHDAIAKHPSYPGTLDDLEDFVKKGQMVMVMATALANTNAQPLTLRFEPKKNSGGPDTELCKKFKAGRAAYEAEVRALEAEGKKLFADGKTPEEVAKELNLKRLDIGKDFKERTAKLGQWIVDRIYGRNKAMYGNEYGPTYDWFKTLEGGRKTDMQIIEGSSKPGGGDIIPQLLKEICGE